MNKLLLSLLLAIGITLFAMPAVARKGADDPAGHMRQCRGCDDVAGHMRQERNADNTSHISDDNAADDTANHGRHGGGADANDTIDHT